MNVSKLSCGFPIINQGASDQAIKNRFKDAGLNSEDRFGTLQLQELKYYCRSIEEILTRPEVNSIDPVSKRLQSIPQWGYCFK